MHGEALQARPAQDHRAVVARRARVEDRQEQRLAESPVERDSALDVALDRLALRQHDQRPDARGGEACDRAHDHIGHVDAAAVARGSAAQAAELLEQTAQILLEHDDDHEHEHREEALEQRCRELEVERAREQVDAAEQRQPRECTPSPGAAHEADREPEQEADRGDVDQIEPGEDREQVRHQRYASASGADSAAATGGAGVMRRRAIRRRVTSSTVAT